MEERLEKYLVELSHDKSVGMSASDASDIFLFVSRSVAARDLTGLRASGLNEGDDYSVVQMLARLTADDRQIAIAFNLRGELTLRLIGSGGQDGGWYQPSSYSASFGGAGYGPPGPSPRPQRYPFDDDEDRPPLRAGDDEPF